jgi:hypothetical protein
VQRRGSSGTTVEDFRRPRLADVNEADAQEVRELRFKVGDALPADDRLFVAHFWWLILIVAAILAARGIAWVAGEGPPRRGVSSSYPRP